jgi:hypothetical protein
MHFYDKIQRLPELKLRDGQSQIMSLMDRAVSYSAEFISILSIRRQNFRCTVVGFSCAPNGSCSSRHAAILQSVVAVAIAVGSQPGPGS